MRIAFFAPLSPMRGGVVDYSEELLPHLAEHCRVDVYTRDGLKPENAALRKRFRIQGHSQFPANDRAEAYDQVIYQLGCSGDHVPDYENLLKRPGLAVLHELNLSGIIGAQTFDRGRPRDYVKAVLDNEGLAPALSVVWRFVRTRQFPDYLAFDFNRVALRHSQGLIVHNDFMRRKIAERISRWRMRRPIYPIRMGVRPAPESPAREAQRARDELGLGEDTFVVGSFGVVHESKGILTALRAFRRLLEHAPNSTYLLVGSVEFASLPVTIQEMGLGDRVRLLGHVDLHSYYRCAAACDVGVNLRVPQTGGTSASLLRLLSAGLPVIVSNHAQFTEIPDDVCFKVSAGDDAEDSVFVQLVDLLAHPESVRRIGERARSYIAQHHSLDRAAQAYWTAIQHSLGRQPASAARHPDRSRDAVIDRV